MSVAQTTTSVDVIVPVFNEEEILQRFYDRIVLLEIPINLIFIDNASTDRSVEIINSFAGVTLIRHETNEGYGGSLRDGICHSTGQKLVIIDADCEYPPEIIPEMVKKLAEFDVVYGSRFLEKNNHFMPYLKRLGNQMISSVFNRLFRQNVTDLYTGCKAMNRKVLEGIELERNGFEHVLELGVKLARKNIRINEIPLDFTPRHTGVAKMAHMSETLKYIYLTCCYFFRVR